MPIAKDMFNPPNVISLLRLLLAPVLLWLAIEQRSTLYFLAIGFTVFTDLLDGFLARVLHQTTALGARLDSWGDFTIYSTLAIGAWIQWPAVVVEYRYACAAIVLSFTLPTLIGLIKYKGLTSYHTWSVKIAVATTVISYILLFANIVAWPFILAAILCVVAAVEEIVITLLLVQNTADIRSLRQALRVKNSSTIC